MEPENNGENIQLPSKTDVLDEQGKEGDLAAKRRESESENASTEEKIGAERALPRPLLHRYTFPVPGTRALS